MRSLNVVGKNVQAVRLSKKPPITQEQLAVRLQTLGWVIDRFGVSKLERGERQVTDKQVLLLADALGVKFSVLLMEMEK